MAGAAVLTVADTIAEMVVYGLVVGLIYRPTPSKRPAGRTTR